MIYVESDKTFSIKSRNLDKLFLVMFVRRK